MLKFAGAASVAGPLAMATGSAWAASAAQPHSIKWDAALSAADASIERLMAGNKRYVSGDVQPVDFAKDRAALSKGQAPFASILSCADSRVGPEYAFDVGRGDIFVTRVAGNFVNTDILASLEYGAAVLGSPLIMVLGHTSCGAIGAAIKAVKDNQDFPGHIQSITSALAPAVRAVPSSTSAADFERAVTIENIKMQVQTLQQATPVLTDLLVQAKLRVVGGLYHLETGEVELVAG
jgi:carbonic anhydrase